MDYHRIYNALIYNAKNRDIAGYCENHHIIPKCMGGTDNNSNIVSLTAREHFVAHQLLVKMYPNNYKLINAANMMCSASSIMQRSKNRRYEWLRIKFSDMQKIKQSGTSNSNYGKIWISNHTLQKSKKINVDEFASYATNGWQKGRVVKWNTAVAYCKHCKQQYTLKTKELFCSNDCKTANRGHMFIGREQELIELYKKYNSLNKAIKHMGFPGAKGVWYCLSKKIIDAYNSGSA